MTKVAVVQSGSVPFDTAATLKKTTAYIEEAAAQGAELVVFPEAYLGTYPKGVGLRQPCRRRTDASRAEYLRYAEGAVTLDGPP